MKFLKSLKQPQVVSLIAMIIIQIALRFGFTFDSAEVETAVLTVIDAMTAVSVIVVAHKSDKDSII